MTDSFQSWRSTFPKQLPNTNASQRERPSVLLSDPDITYRSVTRRTHGQDTQSQGQEEPGWLWAGEWEIISRWKQRGEMTSKGRTGGGAAACVRGRDGQDIGAAGCTGLSGEFHCGRNRLSAARNRKWGSFINPALWSNPK